MPRGDVRVITVATRLGSEGMDVVIDWSNPPERPSKGRIGWWLFAVWVLFAMLVNLYWYELLGALWVMAALFPIVSWALFGGLAIVAVRRCITEPGRVAAPRFLLVLALAGLAVHGYGPRAGRLARFSMHRGYYEAVVAAIERGVKLPETFDVVEEAGPPVRVAFRWSGGILDNWCGVVYDPSGLVLEVNQIDPDYRNRDDTRYRDARMLFGGDLLVAEPLGGPCYFCSFT